MHNRYFCIQMLLMTDGKIINKKVESVDTLQRGVENFQLPCQGNKCVVDILYEGRKVSWESQTPTGDIVECECIKLETGETCVSITMGGKTVKTVNLPNDFKNLPPPEDVVAPPFPYKEKMSEVTIL